MAAPNGMRPGGGPFKLTLIRKGSAKSTYLQSTANAASVIGTTVAFSATGSDIGINGDDLVAEVITDNSTITPPAGWTLITGSTTIWNTNLKYTAYSIRRGASAPALTWAATSVFSVVITAIRPVSGYTAAYNALANSATAITAVSPSLNTSTSNAIVLLGLGLASAANITQPIGFNATTALVATGVAAVNRLQDGAGPTGTNTWTLSVIDQSVSSTITVDYTSNTNISLNAALSENTDQVSGLISSTIIANGSTIENKDIASGVLSSLIIANGAAIEGYDLVSGSAISTLSISLNAAAIEAGDSNAGAISTLFSLNASLLEARDLVVSSISSTIALNSSAIEQIDSVSAAIATQIALNSANSEQNDLSNGTVASQVSLNSNLIEGYDLVVSSISSTIALNSSANEGSDLVTASAISTLATSLNAAMIEAGDRLSATISSIISLNASVIEYGDLVSASDVAITVAPKELPLYGNATLRVKRKKSTQRRDEEIRALLQIAQAKAEQSAQADVKALTQALPSKPKRIISKIEQQFILKGMPAASKPNVQVLATITNAMPVIDEEFDIELVMALFMEMI